MLIAPSILSADMLSLNKELGRIVDSGMDTIHVDIMDGIFAPNLTFGPGLVKSIKNSYPCLYQDCHLMVINPIKWIKPFADAGADSISFHIEAVNYDIKECLDVISEARAKGIRVGIALNPNTDINTVIPLTSFIDHVLIMTVNPGFSGQSFIPECLDKISSLRALYPKLTIQVDGGITELTIKKSFDAGANSFVSGATLFKNPNMKETYKKLNSL